MRSLQCAADGLSMAAGSRKIYKTENHHVFSNKHSRYTPQYKEIMERNNMTLTQKENIIALEGHSGRHTTAYHEFMLNALINLDSLSGGNASVFYEGFMLIVRFLMDNSWLPYAK